MTNIEATVPHKEKTKRKKKKKETPVIHPAVSAAAPLVSEVAEGPKTQEEAFFEEFPQKDWPIIHIPVGSADDRRDNARQFHRGDTQEVPVTSAEVIYTDPIDDGDLSVSEAGKKQADQYAQERETHADLVGQGLIDRDVHTPDLDELQADTHLPQYMIDEARAHEDRVKEALARTTLEVPLYSSVEPKFNEHDWIAGLPKLTKEQIDALPRDNHSGMPSEITVAARVEGQEPYQESFNIEDKFKAFMARVGEEFGEWAVRTWMFKQLMKWQWFKERVNYIQTPLHEKYVEQRPEDMPRTRFDMKKVMAGQTTKRDEKPIS